MFFLGIALVETSDLNPKFLNIANTLSGGRSRPLVWAVFFRGEIVAVYLTPEEAFGRMKLIQAGLDQNQLVGAQTQAEAELLWDLSLEKSSREQQESAYSNAEPQP